MFSEPVVREPLLQVQAMLRESLTKIVGAVGPHYTHANANLQSLSNSIFHIGLKQEAEDTVFVHSSSSIMGIAGFRAALKQNDVGIMRDEVRLFRTPPPEPTKGEGKVSYTALITWNFALIPNDLCVCVLCFQHRMDPARLHCSSFVHRLVERADQK
jgi:hypothetical protein